jgi:hypothetical protein
MTQEELSNLYRLAVNRLSMDSEDVDYALSLEGLDAATCNANQALQAVQKHAPAAAGARALQRFIERSLRR